MSDICVLATSVLYDCIYPRLLSKKYGLHPFWCFIRMGFVICERCLVVRLVRCVCRDLNILHKHNRDRGDKCTVKTKERKKSLCRVYKLCGTNNDEVQID